MKLEELERDYRSERRQLEAQEDELIHFKNQGLRLMEQEEQRLHHVLKNLALDNEPLFQARRSYSNYQEHYQQALQVERRKLYQQQDELERSYRQKIRQITMEKSANLGRKTIDRSKLPNDCRRSCSRIF